MFTGIVQTMATVQSIRLGPDATCIVLDSPELRRPLSSGASVCVAGVCLTVTRSDGSLVEFNAIPETLSRSTLGALSVGDRLNLEPSLRAGDPLDGHIVQGHVDGTGTVQDIRRGPDGHVVTFYADDALMPYVIPKGSITVDGVSLTIVEVGENTFSVALIPATLAATTLGTVSVAQRVNIETDIFARTIVCTVERMQHQQKVSSSQPLTVEMLRENGW